MQLRIQNSQKKKLIEQQSHVRQIEMKFLDKQSSRQYSQVMEEIMRANFRKESQRSMPRSKSRTSVKSVRDFNVFNETPLNTSQYKTVIPSINQKEKHKEKSQSKQKSEKVQIKSQEKTVDEYVKKIPYKFSFKSLMIQLIVAYSVTFALLYFIRLAEFPYFELILIIAFTVAIHPWRSSNLLVLVATGIVFGNHFLGLGMFTYPSILICYYSVMVFNESYKKKQLFVIILIFTMVYGFIILKAIAASLFNQGKISTFAFIFPILMLILRITLSYSYWVIEKTAVIFLQLPLFLTGLEYGVILSFDLSTIQFWYLLVAFSLQIINDRTHFFLNIVVSIKQYCFSKQKQSRLIKEQPIKHRVLPAHANGYACIHSFHLFILVYIYAGLELYTPPFARNDPIKVYITPGYKPIVVWLLTSVYEILSILLEKNRKHVLLFGFTSNKWWKSILRGFVLSLGMWAFYLGLGLGVLFFQTS